MGFLYRGFVSADGNYKWSGAARKKNAALGGKFVPPFPVGGSKLKPVSSFPAKPRKKSQYEKQGNENDKEIPKTKARPQGRHVCSISEGDCRGLAALTALANRKFACQIYRTLAWMHDD
jgi:hypothetical protein